MGMDSVELVIKFEETFGTRIPDQEAAKMFTPRQVIDWLAGHQARGHFFTEPERPLKNTWWRKLRKLPPPPRQPVRLEARNYSREEIAHHVRFIILDFLGVEEFEEDDRFVEDLGMG